MTRFMFAASLAAVASGALALGSASPSTSTGAPPPELTQFANEWPAHNLNLSNTRATTASSINSTNVARLKPKWRFRLKGAGAFGKFSSNPIVLGNTIYLQDLSSNVYALNRATGALEWKHMFRRSSVGPNGVAYGYGKLFGATDRAAFALDPANGQAIYAGNGDGIVYALDAQTGATKWRFNTISDGARLWDDPRVNSGGGLWYPPAVDSSGRVFLAVANPAPFPGTKRFPDGSSRPGPDLYTDTLVALDGSTGKLLWFRQVVRHDIRDYDLQDSPVLGTIPIGGVPTEVVFAAGKMGRVYASEAANGQPIWQRAVGLRRNDVGLLTRKSKVVLPGELGGVETPMAYDGSSLYVPVVNLAFRYRSTVVKPASRAGHFGGTGEPVALNPANGSVRWRRRFATADHGAATVSNDVVFTATFNGKVYALNARTGARLWSAQAPAGVNGFPAVDGDTLLVGAAAPGPYVKHASDQLVAYSLK